MFVGRGYLVRAYGSMGVVVCLVEECFGLWVNRQYVNFYESR